MSQVISGKPDFVDPIIKSDDSIGWHRFPDISNQPLWINRIPWVVCTFSKMRHHVFTDFHEIAEIPFLLFHDPFLDLPHTVGDVSNDFELGKVDWINFGTHEIDMNHLERILGHEKRRLLDVVMADIDDQIRTVNRTVKEIVG